MGLLAGLLDDEPSEVVEKIVFAVDAVEKRMDAIEPEAITLVDLDARLRRLEDLLDRLLARA